MKDRYGRARAGSNIGLRLVGCGLYDSCQFFREQLVVKFLVMVTKGFTI